MTVCTSKLVGSTLKALALVGLFTLVSCTGGRPDLRSEPNVELIQDMMDQPSLKTQDHDLNDPNKPAWRLPPEGTVPQGFKPYPYHNNPDGAEAALKNPIAGDMSPEVVNLGRTKYETYCAVCHGYQGKGDGPVAPKMALKPPPLISEKVIAYKDARIYHIITDGQGVMGSYYQQVPNERDRWAIVAYVRSLQKTTK